jgi:hypothetical protein
MVIIYRDKKVVGVFIVFIAKFHQAMLDLNKEELKDFFGRKSTSV